MRTKYEVTAQHRKVAGASCTTWRDTLAECYEWIAEDGDYAHKFYGYEITTLHDPEDGDGWRRVACTYWLDGVDISEADYVKAMEWRKVRS